MYHSVIIVILSYLRERERERERERFSINSTVPVRSTIPPPLAPPPPPHLVQGFAESKEEIKLLAYKASTKPLEKS